MSLVPSLLQAIVKVDGEAMVMHAGDKPYVVSPTGQIELASRGLTLEAVDAVHTVLRDPGLRPCWDDDSALPRFPVRGLAGHLAAQVFNVERVLGEPPGDGLVLSIVEHYQRAVWIGADLDDPVNVTVREEGERLAAGGPDALAAAVGAAVTLAR